MPETSLRIMRVGKKAKVYMHVVLSLLNDRPLNSLHLEFYWSLEIGDI